MSPIKKTIPCMDYLLRRTSIKHVDHIIPIAKGGETKLYNLQTFCETCNLGKSDLHM